MVKFKLNEKQIEYLQKEYLNNNLAQKVLETQKDKMFEVDLDAYLEFIDYIEDESVYWMGEDYEATAKTIMLETIIDDIYSQTN